MQHRDLFLGFVKLHILYHAALEPVFGLELIRELARHGYTLSPGTLYPVLHRLAEQKLLRVHSETVGGKVRKYYRATAKGRRALTEGIDKAMELLNEIGGYATRVKTGKCCPPHR
ncbi:MAG: PadR family transcriptional regulator [Chitinivibrionales bacterium]|nr:PadR family transcriptional regulator [Chitinivibrionales bacterium]